MGTSERNRLSSGSSDDLHEVYRAVATTLEAADFSGADPYDALNSRLFALTPLASVPVARLAWQQLFKRLPYDLRALTRVPPTVNPVTLALAARTYARADQLEKCRRTIERLLSTRCDPARYGEGAWGYPFPWQAKAFYVPLGTPNVIATAYAVRAIDGCAERPRSDLDRIVCDSAQFVANMLICQAAAGGRYVGYVPGSNAMVHNASLWGAYILALGASRNGSPVWRDLANQAIDYTIRAQTPDGAWSYGEASHHQWTDGFHAGYVLEALQLCRLLLKRNDLAQPIARGMRYYIERFLREDGVVSYYVDGNGPLDVNNFAQMVITLETVRPSDHWPRLADRVLAAAIRELWCPDTRAFAYQRNGKRLNRAFYPRWTQIWMMHALGLLLDQK